MKDLLQTLLKIYSNNLLAPLASNTFIIIHHTIKVKHPAEGFKSKSIPFWSGGAGFESRCGSRLKMLCGLRVSHVIKQCASPLQRRPCSPAVFIPTQSSQKKQTGFAAISRSKWKSLEGLSENSI